jgi:hypothetical protein
MRKSTRPGWVVVLLRVVIALPFSYFLFSGIANSTRSIAYMIIWILLLMAHLGENRNKGDRTTRNDDEASMRNVSHLHIIML